MVRNERGREFSECCTGESEKNDNESHLEANKPELT